MVNCAGRRGVGGGAGRRCHGDGGAGRVAVGTGCRRNKPGHRRGVVPPLTPAPGLGETPGTPRHPLPLGDLPVQRPEGQSRVGGAWIPPPSHPGDMAAASSPPPLQPPRAEVGKGGKRPPAWLVVVGSGACGSAVRGGQSPPAWPSLQLPSPARPSSPFSSKKGLGGGGEEGPNSCAIAPHGQANHPKAEGFAGAACLCRARSSVLPAAPIAPGEAAGLGEGRTGGTRCGSGARGGHVVGPAVWQPRRCRPTSHSP